MNKNLSFNLKSTTTVTDLLSRINTKVCRALRKKKYRKKKEKKNIVLEPCKPTLLIKGSPVDGGHPGGIEYSVKYNAPWVDNIVLSKFMVAGFPTRPKKFNAFNTDQEKSKFTWFKYNKSKDVAKDWQEVAQGFTYTPQVSDIGCKLKLQCLPQKNGVTGPVFEVESNSLVEAGPGHCPFESRHLFTRERLSGKSRPSVSILSFRVTSYNILAQCYIASAKSREASFPYCPPHALDVDYRNYLILKELIGYKSDIICLQEVNPTMFGRILRPKLSTLKYDRVFKCKGGTTNEGISTFFNIHRFQKLRSESTIISKNVNLQGFGQIWKSITNRKVKERFLRTSTVVQATGLLSLDNPTEILVVGNTHLYYHPDAGHIRLLQGYYALTYVRNIANKIKKMCPGHNVSIILCGDFNSNPKCGIYQLMTKNHIPETYKDWNSNPEEKIEGVTLSHNLSFASACGTPQYTNYTEEFADCLDYIFYQTNRLQVEQVIPMPSNDELTEHTALPSVVFPSDHISLCVDLKWNIACPRPERRIRNRKQNQPR